MITHTKENLGFEIGDLIVFNDEHNFAQHEGTVRELDPDDPEGLTIGVNLTVVSSYMLGHVYQKDGIMWCRPSDITPIHEFSLDTRVQLTFGRGIAAWVIKTLAEPPGKPCMIQGCDGWRRNRTLINAHGTVHEIHTCDACDRKYNGRLCDELPELQFVPSDTFEDHVGDSTKRVGRGF